MTETMMLAHAGSVSILKSPTPCAPATTARPTLGTGRTTRTRSTSTASTPRLLGQRQLRATVCGRRGVRTSQAAMRRNTPENAPRRISGSYANKASRMGARLPDKPFEGQLFNYSLESFEIRCPMSTPSPKLTLCAQFATVAKSLAHPHRLEILEQLAQGERSVEVVAARTGLSVANTSQHLQQMRRAGIVAARREGKFILYTLADDAVLDLVSALRRVAERNVAEVEQVIRSHFNDRDS